MENLVVPPVDVAVAFPSLWLMESQVAVLLDGVVVSPSL